MYSIIHGHYKAPIIVANILSLDYSVSVILANISNPFRFGIVEVFLCVLNGHFFVSDISNKMDGPKLAIIEVSLYI